MGRTSKDAKQMLELSNQFEPLELNEGEVQAIFNRCLATEEEKLVYDERCDVQVLTLELTQKSSDKVTFSESKLKKNDRNIAYLLGQIENIHDGSCGSIGLQEGFIRYDDTVWTKREDILLKLFALSVAQGWTSEFSAIPSKPNIIAAFKASNLIPTLSPKDPNFPAWWEAHKSEWED